MIAIIRTFSRGILLYLCYLAVHRLAWPLETEISRTFGFAVFLVAFVFKLRQILLLSTVIVLSKWVWLHKEAFEWPEPKILVFPAAIVALDVYIGLYSPVHVAACLRSASVLSVLLALGAEVDGWPFWGETPLYWAARSGPDEAIRVLIACGARVEEKSGSRESTALHAAVEARNIGAIVELLKIPNIQLNAKEGENLYTPLHTAVRQRNLDAVKLLVARGADLEARDALDRTPLLLAAALHTTWMVRELIALGCSINAQDNEGNTPLHLAVLGGHVALARDLLAAKADPTILNFAKQSPQDIATAEDADVFSRVLHMNQPPSDDDDVSTPIDADYSRTYALG